MNKRESEAVFSIVNGTLILLSDQNTGGMLTYVRFF